MKRVVAIVIIMAVVTSLFAFSVNAAGTPIYTIRKTSAQTFSNVTYSIDVLQFKAASEGTSMLPGGMSQILYVEAYIQNTNDQAALCSLLQFQVNLDLNWTCSNLYTYGGDFMIGMNSLGFYLYPTTDFSYDDTRVIVPPNSTMYFVGAIELTANLDQTGQTIYQSSLESVNLVNKPYSVSLGSYSYGTPVDLSSVITYIDGIESSLNSINNNTDQVESLLNDLIDAFTFTGSYTVPTLYAATNVTEDYTDSNTGIRYYLRTMISPSYLLTYDFETNSGSDTVYSGGTKRYVITQFGRIYNTTSVYQYNTMVVSQPTVSDSSHRPYIVNIDSNFISSGYVYGNNVTLLSDMKSDTTSYRYILPVGINYVVIRFYLDVPLDYIASINDIASDVNPFTIGNLELYTGNSEYGYSERNILNDIKNRLTDLYRSLVKPANEDNTEEAQEMNDDIHEAEQVWYDNNTEALEQVGLSNYRFSQSQSSGIILAVTQFQAVWNALGSWTNVYIFILILSISTYIIRHEPTTRVKQYRSSVQAERAERISYYGRKNAESRAASSGSTFKAALRRRK